GPLAPVEGAADVGPEPPSTAGCSAGALSSGVAATGSAPKVSPAEAVVPLTSATGELSDSGWRGRPAAFAMTSPSRNVSSLPMSVGRASEDGTVYRNCRAAPLTVPSVSVTCLSTGTARTERPYWSSWARFWLTCCTLLAGTAAELAMVMP